MPPSDLTRSCSFASRAPHRLLAGFGDGNASEPVYRQAAGLGEAAETNQEAIPGRVEEGRRREVRRKDAPFSGGLHGQGAQRPQR